jgi:hypothetical protein
LPIVLLALATAADVLRPAGQVEQARVVAEGETAVGLATALIGQANQAGDVVLAAAALDQRALVLGPQARTVIDVGQLMQHSGEHFPAHGAVGAVGLLGGGGAVGEAGQQLAVEVQLGDQRRLAVGIGGHLIGPADRCAGPVAR